MSYNKRILKELKDIIESNIDPTMFPQQKGNSIRVGKIIVRKNKRGYMIYDITIGGSALYETFSKKAALAIAKSYNKGIDNSNKVLELDRRIQKNYNDSVFYKHTIETTKDEFKKDATITRFEIANAETSQALQSLDRYIFF